MPNIIQKNYLAQIRGAFAKADLLAEEGHPGLRGRFREILVGDILLPVMPPEVSFGTGKFVSLSGKSSKQLDVVLYSRLIMPPFMYSGNEGYFPIESGLYSIEVKSKLTKHELQKSIESAQTLASLPMANTEHWSADPTGFPNKTEAPIAIPIVAIFAFGSDLKSDPQKEIDRYRELDANADTNPAVGVICIRGRGYWWFGDEWNFLSSNEDHREVMSWIAGTVNTMPQLITAKGRPRFGNYLSRSDPFQKV